MNPELTKIVTEARNGDRPQAMASLHAYTTQNSSDAEGWLALGALTTDVAEARHALSQALALRPGWPVAQAILDRLPYLPEVNPEPKAEEIVDISEPDDDDDGDEDEIDDEIALADDGAEDQAFDSLEDARAALWPFAPSRRNKIAIGELIDTGAITREDLEYSAKHARSEHVREASAYILEYAAHNTLASVNLSPTSAAELIWPFKKLNRPLGQLLRDKQVQPRDLRKAAFFAKEKHLRQAARLALAGELDDLPSREKAVPVTPIPADTWKLKQKDHRTRFQMRIVRGDDYLAHEIRWREARVRLLEKYVFGAAVMGVLGVVLILAMNIRLWYLASFVAVICAGGIYWLRARIETVRGQIELFTQGHTAEVTVARYLREYLDDRWTLFRNVKLPVTNTDIDLVLLGPPGIFAIEIKAYKGTFRYKHDTFYRYSRRKWRNMRGNPGKQARATAGILHSYISDVLHTDVWVEPKLVWAGPGALELVKPEVRVWYMNNLQDEMQRLKHLSGRLSPHKRAMVYGMLSGLSSMYETKRPG